MADVFLSYAREDLDRAETVAAALEEAGYSVWWDRNLGGGSEYSTEIERALAAAAAVVVLWSKSSVHSAWVRDEAAKGRDTGRLIPATIDGTEPPLGFGQHHTIDLQRLSRRRRGGIEHVVAAARERIGNRSQVSELRDSNRARRPLAGFMSLSPRMWIAAAGALLLTSAALLYLFNPLPLGTSAAGGGEGGSIAVGEFEPLTADQETQRVARLTSEAVERIFATNFIETLSARSATPAALKDADFGLNGTVDRQGDELSVSATIVDVSSGKTLWSTERVRSADEARQLANELAIWVADVLRCSVFAKSRIQNHRSTDVQSRILRWCEAERSRGDQFDQMPGIAQELVDVAPKSPQAHGYLAMGIALGAPERRADVYAAARRALELDSNNGAARFALAAVPDSGVSLAQRDRLLRDGIRLDPDFNYNEIQLASLMMTVGRIEEAMSLYEDFLSNHPLDYQQRAFWALLLANSGNLRQSRLEFDRIEQLRPGFRYGTGAAIQTEILFGDPLKARPLIERWDTHQNEEKCLEFVIDARVTGRSPGSDSVNRHCGDAGLFSREALNGLFGNIDAVYAGMHQKADEYMAVPRFGPRFLFYQGLESLRADQRFMPLMERLGIAQYWIETGNWPDFCTTEQLPYDCRRAAETAVATTAPR